MPELVRERFMTPTMQQAIDAAEWQSLKLEIARHETGQDEKARWLEEAAVRLMARETYREAKEALSVLGFAEKWGQHNGDSMRVRINMYRICFDDGLLMLGEISDQVSPREARMLREERINGLQRYQGGVLLAGLRVLGEQPVRTEPAQESDWIINNVAVCANIHQAELETIRSYRLSERDDRLRELALDMSDRLTENIFSVMGVAYRR